MQSRIGSGWGGDSIKASTSTGLDGWGGCLGLRMGRKLKGCCKQQTNEMLKNIYLHNFMCLVWILWVWYAAKITERITVYFGGCWGTKWSRDIRYVGWLLLLGVYEDDSVDEGDVLEIYFFIMVIWGSFDYLFHKDFLFCIFWCGRRAMIDGGGFNH